MTRGYVGLTDPDWYSFLQTRPRVDEVNFWQPHGGRMFRALTPGEFFFFKLRAPHKAIGGFGFFERFADYVFQVGERLRDEFKNGRSYYGLDGSPIAVPGPQVWRPSKALLDWHGQEIFKG